MQEDRELVRFLAFSSDNSSWVQRQQRREVLDVPCQEISYKTNHPLKQKQMWFWNVLFLVSETIVIITTIINLPLISFLFAWRLEVIANFPTNHLFFVYSRQASPKLPGSATVGKSGDERRWKVMASCGEATPRWSRHMSCLEAGILEPKKSTQLK